MRRASLLHLLLVSGTQAFVVTCIRPRTAQRTLKQATITLMADGGAGDSDTNWEDAMAQLRARQAQSADQAPAEDDSTLLPPPPDSAANEEVETQPFRFEAPPSDATPAGGGGFRYERKEENNDDMVAGLDRQDQALLRNATLIGGRLLTAITLSSLIFYIYIGVSGGITDGFDRFDEPIEDIRITIAREGVDAMPAYGGPSEYGFMR